MVMARMLKQARNGRAEILPQSNCACAKRPSNVSSMREDLVKHYKFWFFSAKNFFLHVEHNRCRTARRIFLLRQVFNTSVDKPVKITRVPEANSTNTNKLVLFAQF
jgi:hypothetical protein